MIEEDVIKITVTKGSSNLFYYFFDPVLFC
jgi:hypothetical protein